MPYGTERAEKVTAEIEAPAADRYALDPIEPPVPPVTSFPHRRDALIGRDVGLAELRRRSLSIF
jgi:hypothetical protein